MCDYTFDNIERRCVAVGPDTTMNDVIDIFRSLKYKCKYKFDKDEDEDDILVLSISI